VIETSSSIFISLNKELGSILIKTKSRLKITLYFQMNRFEGRNISDYTGF